MLNKKFLILCSLFLILGMVSVSASENATEIQTLDESAGDISSVSIDAVNYHPNESADNGCGLNLSLEHSSLNEVYDENEGHSLLGDSLNVNVVKLNSTLTPVSTAVIKGDYFYVDLKDQNGASISNVTVDLLINGNNYHKTTDSNGRVAQKITLAENTYPVQVSFSGNDYYGSVSKIIDLTVQTNTTLLIGNDVILSKGYLRVYLKSALFSTVSNRTLFITVGDKNFTKTTNTEGIVIFKPKVGEGTFNVTVTYAGDTYIAGAFSLKTVTGIKGSALNPLNSEIPLKDGLPNVDYMSSKYVMADEDMEYTLLKAQYQDVIKRDSYCLYLNKKLTHYTYFKSQSEPKLNHIIKREKWNVIERAINTKIVKKNKNGYWPSKIRVSLFNKSYTYSEVRDVQNTGYTCGPTSASMCSQVLRNYINEKQLATQAGSDPDYGSSTSGLKRALEKNNFKCAYFYKSSFSKALKHLKKGGCALIFHTWYHYVAILDISKDGKYVLVGNPSGDYDEGSHGIPTNWLSVDFMIGKFNDYDTSGLVVKLKYSLSKKTIAKMGNFYSNFGSGWTRQNTDERLPQI